MKKVICVLFMLCLGHFSLITLGTTVSAIDVIDGDTIQVGLENGNKFFVRLQGIDCFETSSNNRSYKQAYEENISIDEVINRGLKAKKYLQDMLLQTKRADLKFMGLDKYNRVFGNCLF